MNTLVIYDTNFGNTKIIAEAIAEGLGKGSKTINVTEASEKDLKGSDILIAGSPIIGWKPSERMQGFLGKLAKGQLKGMKAASFDTRAKIFHGDAAKKISQALKDSGAEIISEPSCFYVKGKEGPLFNGEKEKAVEWGKKLKELCG